MAFDVRNRLFFTTLQSSVGRELYQTFEIPEDLKSMVYMREGECFFYSDAVLELCRDLGGVARLLWIMKAFPKTLRDYVYRFIANHRYQWLGKTDSEVCSLVSPEMRKRILP